ncbi:MAG: permease [Pseudomonadota bacterium]
MSAAATSSLAWFGAHEARLIWRDFLSMMTGGKPQRRVAACVVVTVIAVGLHMLASHLLSPALVGGVVANKPVLLFVSGGLVMFFSLMFSQAIEAVTRAYYARSDLDLILSSPAPADRLFAVRSAVLTVQTILLSFVIASPIINVMIWQDGAHWLAAYLVLAGMGAVATSLSVLLTLLLFRTVGPQRTRLIAQIIAAVVGAGFVIALQGVAILLGEGISRFSLFSSPETVSAMPELSSSLWLLGKAAMGELPALLTVLVAAFALWTVVMVTSSRRFARDVMRTVGMSAPTMKAAAFAGFKRGSNFRSAMRRKEFMLLKRDPWLISQSLQQILYLVPPALLLWVNYADSKGVFFVIVPVIVMATGQLAGGLAWITISGEDAHELIDTAPLRTRDVLRAKVEAVLCVIAMVVLPFAAVLATFSVKVAFITIVGAAMASASAVTIQLWFRSQANRSLFRRRQVSSRTATLCEAFVAILWALASAVAIAQYSFALVPALFVAMVMALAWFLSPPRET